MRSLYLIDGTYELFRAFYAMPSRQSPSGQEVGAIRGLVASMATLLRDARVTHIAAATDHVIESFRNELFAGYKTGAGIDPNLWSQFPLAEEALRALGITVWPMIDFEADDAIATAAARFAPDADRIVICSPDKDLCQCVVGERVVAWDRQRDRVYDEQEVRTKFGVAPGVIPDLLALVGDSADGIPGIKGWGMKSAAAILDTYGSIEAIPPSPSDWTCQVRGAAGLAERLLAARSEVGLYKTLATLRTDVPLQESLEHLQWRAPSEAQLMAFCAKIGMSKPPALRGN